MARSTAPATFSTSHVTMPHTLASKAFNCRAAASPSGASSIRETSVLGTPRLAPTPRPPTAPGARDHRTLATEP
eukprot:11356927-Alexandrium_andersonii.AAC.1